MPHLLDVRGLSVEMPTPTGWVRPVDDVSFTLAERETLGLVGESGSGKTMLALALMGLQPPGARRSGEAWLAERDVASAPRPRALQTSRARISSPPAKIKCAPCAAARSP